MPTRIAAAPSSSQEPASEPDPGAPLKAQAAAELAWLTLVAEKVQSLQYGAVQIVVHDSQVVQVERTERFRFETQRRST